MKKLFLLLALGFLSLQSFSQIDYASLKTDKKEDFTEDLNKAALQAATELLSMPIEKDNRQRLETLQFLLRWMTGSPDFTFNLDETATKISKGNDDLLGIYLAAMCKYALENKDGAKDSKALKLNTVKSVLAYCKTQNVKLTSELKKMDKANEAGELESYLKL